MAFTTAELEEIWAYVSGQIQRVRINELPKWSDYGEIALQDRLPLKMMSQDKTVWIPISELAPLIGGGSAGFVLTTPALTLSVPSDTQINASWLAVANATEYKLYRSQTPNFNDSELVYQGSALLFNDTGCTPLTTYYYWLQAVGSGYLDSQYATASITTTGATADTTPPVLVSGVVGAAHPYWIVLGYNEALTPLASADTSKFTVNNRTIAAIEVTGATVVIHVDQPYIGGEPIQVSYTGSYVRDLAGNLAATFSNIGMSNTITPQPVQLTPPTFTATAVGTNAITLNWGSYITGTTNYAEIERSTDGTTFAALVTLGPSDSTYTDNSLTTNTTYYYRLRVVGDGTQYLTSNWTTASATTNASAAFDTVLTFVSSTSSTAAGVHGQVLATNGNIRLRFTAQTGNLGVNTMNILRFNGTTYVQKMRVDFPGEYTGQPFEFEDTDGTLHTDVFVNNNVRF